MDKQSSSAEKEFAHWLRRPEKTFRENLQFALNAWKSADLTLCNKYEIILEWLSEACRTVPPNEEDALPIVELCQLFAQRAHPGLVAHSIKLAFVQTFVDIGNSQSRATHSAKSRSLAELLHALNEFEVIQDILRTHVELQAQLQQSLLNVYDKYLKQFDNENVVVDDVTKSSSLNSEQEAKFFGQMMKTITTAAKRASDKVTFATAYNMHVVQPLTEVLLRLRALKLCFFKDFLELERLIMEEHTDEQLIERIAKLPLHTQLLAMECGMANRRDAATFLKPLLQRIFGDENADGHEPRLRLTIATYTLEMLRKYELSLAFELTDESTAVQFIGNGIYEWVKCHKAQHLREVLMLLCATLRFNPLILEQHIFNLTTWMMVAPKRIERNEQSLFEEYLVLLIDMFRRLSQVEKFVGNLFRSLQQWLQNFELPAKLHKSKRKQSDVSAHTPKRRKCATNSEDDEATEQTTAVDKYLQILFHSFTKVRDETLLAVSGTAAVERCESFAELHSIWPSGTVGVAFTRLVSGLVSKPSLVIWKTLLYNLKELFARLPTGDASALTDNQLFEIDFYAAMLCEYLNGCRLVEQYNLYEKQITEQLSLMSGVLSLFGRYVLLASDYRKRPVRAFMECVYAATSFQHVLADYRPDADVANVPAIARTQHACLSDSEWSLLQQRVSDAGSTQCKFLYNRLQLQQIKSDVLCGMAATEESDQVEMPTISLQQQSTQLIALTNESKQLQMLLQSTDAHWFERHLQHEEKLNLCKQLLDNGHQLTDHMVATLTEDAKTLQFLVFNIYERLRVACNAKPSKNALLAKCPFDFATLYVQQQQQSQKQYKHSIQAQMAAIRAAIGEQKPLELPVQQIGVALEQLQRLPVAYLQPHWKLIAFTLQLALYCDLRATSEAELTASAYDILADMLHLGPQIRIFKYLDCAMLQQLFPAQQYTQLYEIFFAAIKNEEKGSDKFLIDLVDTLKQQQSAETPLSSDERTLMLMAIEALASMAGPPAKRMRKHLHALLVAYQTLVHAHFRHTNGEQPKKDKKFVGKTIAGFAAYANAALTAAQGDDTKRDSPFVVDDEFRRLFKIYIGYSLDFRDSHGVRLVQVALNHRQQLHFAQNEIEFTLSAYWQQLNACIKESENILQTEKTAETVVKLIVAFKTNEDFLILLKCIGNQLTDDDVRSGGFLKTVLTPLTLIAKCPFSTVKGAIFNEQCKQILHTICMQLVKDETQQFVDRQAVLSILNCQLAMVQNKMLSVSLDTLDSILCFLIDINIKRLKVDDSNVNYFTSLHLAMTELCMALIKYQHILLVDRVAQFMHIFKDLTRAIVWYKCDRENDAPLTASELEKVAELAVKLEALMHLITNHSVSFKRISPFIITFVINLMVAEKRTTTLYPNIKKYIDSVCYDLIGLCDNRVGGFILRCSNEASRQVYEKLVKEHNKYHKFKGKV